MEGIILKGIGGLYTVRAGEGIYPCRLRGKLRRENLRPVAGDRVRFTPGDEEGIVSEVLPRRNYLIRPAMANLDQLAVLATEAPPVTDPLLIDKICVMARYRGIAPAVIVNKIDLQPGVGLYETYSSAGIPVLRVSAVTGEGLDGARDLLRGKITALAGNSGAGKSTLLNALYGFHLPTGDLSEKIGRGKHTTRAVEMFALPGGGFIADTPGFSMFDLLQMDLDSRDELSGLFPEFEGAVCRFQGCAHIKEQGCGVIAAVERGEIARGRHESYRTLYESMKDVKEWEVRKRKDKAE